MVLVVLLVFLFDQLLLLLEHLEPLLVRRRALGVVHLQLDLVEELFRDGGEHGLQGVDLRRHLRLFALGVHEGVAEHEERRWHPVLEPQVRHGERVDALE